MPKTLVEMAQEIVQAQAAGKAMTMEEIRVSLQETYRMLRDLQASEAGEANLEAGEGQIAPNIEPKKSIRRNSIVCLECGAEFKMLSPKHLASHDLDSKSYRKKYGLSARQPLCAKSLSERRAQGGRERGLPENLRKYLDARSEKKQAREQAAASQAEEAPKPATRGRKAQPEAPQE